MHFTNTPSHLHLNTRRTWENHLPSKGGSMLLLVPRSSRWRPISIQKPPTLPSECMLLGRQLGQTCQHLQLVTANCSSLRICCTTCRIVMGTRHQDLSVVLPCRSAFWFWGGRNLLSRGCGHWKPPPHMDSYCCLGQSLDSLSRPNLIESYCSHTTPLGLHLAPGHGRHWKRGRL